MVHKATPWWGPMLIAMVLRMCIGRSSQFALGFKRGVGNDFNNLQFCTYKGAFSNGP